MAILTLFRLNFPEIKRFVFYPKKFECIVEFEDVGSAQSLIESQKSLQFPMLIRPLPKDKQVKKPNKFVPAFRETNEFPVMNTKSSKKMSAIEMLSHETRSDVNTARQELENLMRKQTHTAEER